MLALISFIVVMVGAINWFCIGLLQYDFVAGLFGSQSSMFSRIVYIAVGLGALVLLYNLIENKGKIKFNFKKKTPAKKEYERQGVDMYYTSPRPTTEAGQDIGERDNIATSNHNTDTTLSQNPIDSNSYNKGIEADTDNLGRDVTEETRNTNTKADIDMAENNQQR